MFSFVIYVQLISKSLKLHNYYWNSRTFFLYPSTKYFFDKFIYSDIESTEDTWNRMSEVLFAFSLIQNFDRNNVNIPSCDLGTGHLSMGTKKTQKITIGKTNWLARITSLEISHVFFSCNDHFAVQAMLITQRRDVEHF